MPSSHLCRNQSLMRCVDIQPGKILTNTKQQKNKQTSKQVKGYLHKLCLATFLNTPISGGAQTPAAAAFVQPSALCCRILHASLLQTLILHHNLVAAQRQALFADIIWTRAALLTSDPKVNFLKELGLFQRLLILRAMSNPIP